MSGTRNVREVNAREAGFTLFEAFIVLTIIAILAVVSVPAIVNLLTIQKLASATDAFVNQAQFARVQAAARNRAYELRVILSDGVNSGVIVLNEGISAACPPAVLNAGVVQQNFELDGAVPEPVMMVRNIVFENLHERDSGVIIESVEPAELDFTSLCFKPDGRVLRLDTGAPVLPAPEGYAAGEAVYTLRIVEGSSLTPTNFTRRVVIPYNGIPKVL